MVFSAYRVLPFAAIIKINILGRFLNQLITKDEKAIGADNCCGWFVFVPCMQERFQQSVDIGGKPGRGNHSG